jgi:hypothetical protein
MSEVEAHSRDGLWVLLKLERLKAHPPGVEPDEEQGDTLSTSGTSWRLTVRADDKIDPSRLISLFRAEIERIRGAVPAAMQPFYVYGVVVFEWHEKTQYDGDLLGPLKELVAVSDLKRGAVPRQ